jgi:tryptophanyl-tRNA synthetase
MSKSAGNAILLSDSGEEIRKKLRGAVTDPLKVRKNDPGRPEICLVFTYHRKFNPGGTTAIETDCRSGALGCVECKLKVADLITENLAPFRERRRRLESNPDEVRQILSDGEQRARTTAIDTMSSVHHAMQLG